MPGPTSRTLCTINTLAYSFTALGIRPGDTILLHASLRSLGWVCGRAEAVVRALLTVLGPTGTLVVPTQTENNSDPAHWRKNPVPEAWWPTIRAELPAFDPAVTPSAGMGAVAEAVRTWPGAARSAHPQTSFAAVGARARELMRVHDVDCRLGERSPLGAMESAGARVLLLGVGWDKCTALHLAEYRVERERMELGFAVDLGLGKGREWMTVQEPHFKDELFEELGREYERMWRVVIGKVGDADARLFELPDVVEFAKEWFTKQRAER